MEFPDVKIGWIGEWLLGRAIQMDVEGVLVIMALFLISWSLRSVKQEVSKGSITVIRLDKTMEENTDALIENTRLMKSKRRSRRRYDSGSESDHY